MIHQTAKRVRQKSACEAKGGPLWVRIARGRPYSSKVAVNTACTAGVVVSSRSVQRTAKRLAASEMVNGSQRSPLCARNQPFKSAHQTSFGSRAVANGPVNGNPPRGGHSDLAIDRRWRPGRRSTSSPLA